MDESHWRALIELSRYSVIIVALFAVLRLRKADYTQRYLCYLVFASLIAEFGALFIVKYFKTSNLPLLHVFTIVEFVLIAYLYRPLMEQLFSKKGFYTIVIGFSTLSVLNSLFHENIFQFNTYARALQSLLIILLTLFYFFNTLKRLVEKKLEESPLFWISTGLLLYFSSSLFIFIYSNVLFGVGKNSHAIWGIHAIFSLVLYIFYSIALWVKPKI